MRIKSSIKIKKRMAIGLVFAGLALSFSVWMHVHSHHTKFLLYSFWSFAFLFAIKLISRSWWLALSYGFLVMMLGWFF